MSHFEPEQGQSCLLVMRGPRYFVSFLHWGETAGGLAEDGQSLWRADAPTTAGVFAPSSSLNSKTVFVNLPS